MESDIQRIIDRIHQNARINANRILSEAHNSINAMIKKQRELVHEASKEEVDLILKRGEEEAEALRRTLIFDAKKRANWKILSVKERLVLSVLDEVKNRLRSFSKSEMYIPFLQKLIVDAAVGLKSNTLEVILRKRDATLSLNLGLLEEKIKEKTGLESKLEVTYRRSESLGGCVMQTQNGKIVINSTFSALLKQQEKRIRIEIAKMLFQ